MAISATFSVGDLCPYVEHNFEDPSDLRANPFEEGKVDTEHGTMGDSRDQGIASSRGSEGN